MQRIGAAFDAVLNLFGTGKHGYTNGAPGITAATIADAGAMNSIQEELANLAESTDDINALDNFQALRAVRKEIDIMGLYTMAQRVSSPPATPVDAASATDGSLVFVSGGASNPIYAALDGVTFAAKSMGSGSTNVLRCVASNADKYCAVGDSGEIQTSDAGGQTWTKRTPAGGFSDVFYGVAAYGSKWIAVGNTGEIQVTPTSNLAAWSQYAAPIPMALHGIAVNNGVAVVVGDDSTNYGIFRSTDGVLWSTVKTGLGTPRRVSAIPGGFIVHHQTSSPQISTDYGLTWRNVTVSTAGFSLGTFFSAYSGLMGDGHASGFAYRRKPDGAAILGVQAGAAGYYLKRTENRWFGVLNSTGSVWTSSAILPWWKWQ